MKSSALISPCEKYRYWLKREVSPGALRSQGLLMVMLNPSTADADQDDPTIRRCMGFAESWGCSDLTVVNLYAARETKPANLWTHDDPVGEYNDMILAALLKESDRVLCAWGANAKPDRVRKFLHLAKEYDAELWCLGTNADGSPKHPLYLKGNTEPRLYK